ncbi:MAG: sodium:solute symporter family protein [Rhodothermales bacterium]|nr:sodium:solute symporter family protein [Rhodothermales bacterium]
MNVVFTWLDWFWVVLFLLLMTGSGVLFYRLGRRSQSDFFLAGRGLPWWLPASSVYATHTATDTPMWISGVVYRHGLAGLWYTFFAAWCAISAFVSTRIFRRSLAYTQAEWNVVRFSGLGAEMLRGWMAGWQVFMNMFILGWVGMAMGKICEFLFGWAPWIGLISFSAVCAIYVLSAGYWGVVMADFQQGVIAFCVIIIVSVWGIVEAGGPSGISDRLTELGRADMMDPFAFTGWFGGDFPIAWFLTMLFIAILGGFGMGTAIDWFPEAQRIQSARTVRDASYSIWWGTAFVLMRNSIWGVAILGFFVLFPDLTETADYEMAWFRLGFDFLPAGMLGFFFAAILAIHLSTISSHLNLGALYATRDLYQHYVNPQASERRLVWVGRWATLILLLGSFVYGLMMEEITSWLIFALWIMAAGIWLPNILQVVWWRFNAWGYLSSWIANLGFSWLVVWVLPELGVIPPLAEYQQFWMLMLLGALVYMPVTFLTRPEPMDHLVKYYVMARPIGWWGPVRREAIRRGLITAKGDLTALMESGPSEESQ